MLHLLHSFGKENGEIYIKYIKPKDPNLTGHEPHVIVYHKPYEKFYSQHKEEFVKKATDTIERLLGRKVTSDERRKLERAFELAVEYGKRFHDIYKGVNEDIYHLTATSAHTHYKEGYRSIEYAEKTLGIDFLEKVGDIILELNRLFPGFSKPEEVYGDRWYEFLKKRGIDPKTLEPIGKKPKFPEAKKAVEEELRKAGVPEEQIKIIAPRLATAVWLENQIRALKESTPARLYGGVPVAELRNLREKVLAKKHVAEKAAKIIENYWMKGTIVPIKEEHLDPKMLPFVREHASGMMEDIRNLAERVKRGELDPQDVRTILAVERDLLDRTHEAIEKTMGNPENLIENRRAYGVEDKFMVKGEALEKMHRELKPHFETARVKIPVKGKDIKFDGPLIL